MLNESDTIRELDVVALLQDLPEQELRAGQTGTVVMTHGDGAAFEVEFIVAPRRSVLATLPRSSILKLRSCKHVESTSA